MPRLSYGKSAFPRMPISDWLAQGFVDFFNKYPRIRSVSRATEKAQEFWLKKSTEICS